MKKKMLCIVLTFSSYAFAQVGIGTNNPSATLEIKVDPSTLTTGMTAPPGFIAPKITGDDLKGLNENYGNSQIGAIVFVTSLPTGEPTPLTVDINSSGFYYFNGVKWEQLGTGTGNGNSNSNPSSGINWFYAPSIVLPTTPDSDILDVNYTFVDDVYQVKLYDLYTNQFVNAIKSSTTNLPIINKDDLDYYVSYFDPTVFEDIRINSEGVLSYKILPGGIVSEKTFMNIIFNKK